MPNYWAGKGLGTERSRYALDVNRQTIVIDSLPEAFEGFTVVQISDLHIDRWNAAIVESAIEAVNDIHPDLLLCTGDVIADGKDYLGDVSHLLIQMNARHRKLACLGNHDYSDGSESLGVRNALNKAGFEVLINESMQLDYNNSHINIAGADDYELGTQCLTSTHQALSEEAPTILLCHNPSNFKAITAHKPNLVLSGHTHGGQIPIPQRLLKKLLGTPFVSGHYHHQDSQLYVNRGLGVTVFIHHWLNQRLSLPTPRWKVRSEITVLTLSRGGSALQPQE